MDYLNKNQYGEQMNYPAVRAMVKRRAKIAHLEKRVNLNMFRHSEATNSAKFMTESQLSKRHGWSPESKMPAKYVHLINADVDDAIFKHLGIKKEKEEITNMPQKCHICDMPNSPDATMCTKCGKPLGIETAIEFDEKIEKMMENYEEKLAKATDALERAESVIKIMGIQQHLDDIIKVAPRHFTEHKELLVKEIDKIKKTIQ